MPKNIYHGAWINWSHGPVGGATLTLGEREGGLLIAFIAFFVTLVGAQLFKILTYFFHQLRSRQSAQDGLYHQQQVIFKNAASPGSTAWSFLQQTWAWNNKARSSLFRTLPWALFCLFYLIVFGLAAIFSSEITKSPGSARLIIGDTCGYWSTADDFTSAAAVKAYSGRLANTSLANSAYSRECYGGSPDSLGCGKMMKPALKTKINVNASCPFADGMCEWGDNAAFEIMSERIDSLYDLGINSRHKDRLHFQKVATCSPISKDGFWQTLPGGVDGNRGIVGDALYAYMYGPSTLIGGTINSSDYTHVYNNHTSIDNVGYTLSSTFVMAGDSPTSSGWKPIPELNQTSADLNIMFLSQNAIAYAEPVEDPMFFAHRERDVSSILAGTTYYLGDWYVNIMACADQYQICNPENQQCTGLVGANQIIPYVLVNNDKLELNNVQQAIVIRMMNYATASSIHTTAIAQSGSGLLANDAVVDKLSQPLPINQWHLEVENFFNKGLASIQLGIVDYAAGPVIGPGAKLYQPWTDESTGGADSTLNIVAEAMCYSQMINDSSDSISFSLAGMIVLFSVGGLIILVSLFIDTLVGWIQQRFNIGTHARMCWLLDDKLQLHRFLNQELGHGQWSEDYEAIPNTVSPQKFDTLAAAQQRGGVGEKMVKYPTEIQEQASMEGAAPAYQGVGHPSRGYTQVTTTEEHWQAK